MKSNGLLMDIMGEKLFKEIGMFTDEYFKKELTLDQAVALDRGLVLGNIGASYHLHGLLSFGEVFLFVSI